ncbi:MAG: iron uptake porin [Stigonema ocellatum SAG 48.90 = DSM 106950]|nr:iron uptake porin [Stigonema ocellatum SAG 48.90 = DSM 106950]
MSNLLWKSLVVSPAVLGATLLVSMTAIAAPNSVKSEVVKTEVSPTKAQEASTSVSELANSTAVTEVAQQPETFPQAQQTKVNVSGLANSTAVTKVAQNTQTLSNSQQQTEVNVSGLANSTAVTKVAQKSQTLSNSQQQSEVNVLNQVNNYSNEGNNNSVSQVTSVSQFSDVQPTDWAFQALQSLVERYGCIAGYPNGTFRGNRALTRYEFAAGLNACLDRVNELIATATSDIVKKEDLGTLQRLQEEFASELASLRGRVDALESRTAEIEANQFSTTTKLVGEAIFALSDTLGDTNAGKNNRTVLQDRVRLDFQTSFTGRDVLHTRISAANGGFNNRFDLGTAQVGPAGGQRLTSEGTQTFSLSGINGSNSNNSVNLDWLGYYVPIGPANVYIVATGGTHSDYAPTNNPYFEDFDGGNGALSTFASRNPIYNIGGGAGGAVSFKLGKGGGIFRPSSINLGYLASDPNNPGLGRGIANGNYAALGQVNFNIGSRVALGATYVHGYHKGGSAIFDQGGFLQPGTGIEGTAQANRLVNAAESNNYGIEGAFKLSDKISISGFGTYSDVSGKIDRRDNFQAWTYGGGIALADLGKKGNVLGLFAGAEPYALNRRGFSGSDTPIHVEGFYKYRVSDNISVTPGVIYLTSPGQSSNNDDVFIGTLRTTFTF